MFSIFNELLHKVPSPPLSTSSSHFPRSIRGPTPPPVQVSSPFPTSSIPTYCTKRTFRQQHTSSVHLYSFSVVPVHETPISSYSSSTVRRAATKPPSLARPVAPPPTCSFSHPRSTNGSRELFNDSSTPLRARCNSSCVAAPPH